MRELRKLYRPDARPKQPSRQRGPGCLLAHWSGSVGHVRESPSRMHSRPSRKGIGYADRRDERRPLLPPSPPAGGSAPMPVADATAQTWLSVRVL